MLRMTAPSADSSTLSHGTHQQCGEHDEHVERHLHVAGAQARRCSCAMSASTLKPPRLEPCRNEDEDADAGEQVAGHDAVDRVRGRGRGSARRATAVNADEQRDRDRPTER